MRRSVRQSCEPLGNLGQAHLDDLLADAQSLRDPGIAKFIDPMKKQQVAPLCGKRHSNACAWTSWWMSSRSSGETGRTMSARF